MSDAVGEMLGTSDAITRLRALTPKIARSSAPILITGSTGTGKEHFARGLHRASRRAHAPFVAINCGAIPDTLFEAELFGFERGSFTGAFQAQKGKAVLADGGTLFLDEIGELPPLSQTKLLRMLEEREVNPIGAQRPVKVDLRIVAATNRAVEEQVEEGSFRSDLYYRLNVARVDLPDLSERREDIALYLHHFIDRFNRRDDCRVGSPDNELMNVLLDYDWPGNVREVRNFVEGVFIDPPDGPIGVCHIPAAFLRLQSSYSRSSDEERNLILSVLEKTDWNKVEAAKELHWSRMTLYRKLTKHHVTRGGAGS
ncbi:sigma 54-interacting transcriptional regulator [Sphingomonas sp. So64.6b]|uniref:sigma-54 interaction domain-containing protein n=1 Tax=Sphingomonas sp. So64.6b TaxID=2997354 RepID=UPI001922521E|nr:sigma 54-interacting transcriptional regulator [Sphingomonas sp. So64.6b]